MEFYGDGGSINHTNLIQYIQNQFPAELTQLVNLQAELEQRQGALSAVANANADREAAATQLKLAKDEAAAILADAKAEYESAKSKTVEIEARENALDMQAKAFSASSAEREVSLTNREKAADARDIQQDKRNEELTVLAAKLAADQSALDARVKTFQDKVAALSA
jgi:chromosome segregation ATPase